MKKRFEKIIILAAIFLPSVVRILFYNLDRIHGDDMLTAYFSAHYNLLKTNFFAPVPPNPRDWVSQFPSPFFFFQKIFFLIAGENLLSIKLSVIPYILIVSVFLFLITKKLVNEKIAFISLFFYAFFAPSLYLETLGLHFISSTAVFMIFFYFALRNLKSHKKIDVFLAGIFCAFCYLFYSSSYIAFPVFILFFLWEIVFTKQKLKIFKNYALGFFVFAIILSPFIFNMIQTKNFYLTARYDQVSLLSGTWSPDAKTIKTSSDASRVILANMKLAVSSMWQDGIGGHGGYNFGHLAFFDKFNLAMFILGLLASFYFLFVKKSVGLMFVFAVIIISFLTGVVLTIPPPAFHRFSLAFPFIAIIMAIPFYSVFKVFQNRRAAIFFVAVFIVIFGTINLTYFKRQVEGEDKNNDVALSKLIIEKYPNRNIYVATFPGFVFEKVFYFLDKPPRRKIRTDYHINFLNNFNKHEKYLYIIIFPESFNNEFREKDPSGTIIKYSGQYSLFIN